MTRVLPAVAARLGIREGQAASVLVGMVVALVLGATGLPGVLAGRERAGAADLAGAPRPSASTPDPAAIDLPPVVAPVPGTSVPRPELATTGSSPSSSSPVAAAPSPGPAAQPPSITPGPAPLGTQVLARVPAPGTPGAVAIAADGTVFVVTDDGVLGGGRGPSALFAFAPDGAERDRWDVEGQPETRSRGLSGVAVAADGTVWVADGAIPRLLRLDPGARRLAEVAVVPDLRSCIGVLVPPPCEPGLVSRPPALGGLAVGEDGTVYVADRGQGVLWSGSPDGELSVLHAFDDRLPGEGPVDVTVRHDGSLGVALSARATSVPPGSPSVVVLPRSDDGTGEPVVVADLSVGEVPGAIAAGDSGRLYLTIPSAGVVIDLGVEQGDRIVLDGDDVDPAFQAPTGVAVGDGALVVSDPGSSALAADEPHRVLYRVAVGDRPVQPRNAR